MAYEVLLVSVVLGHADYPRPAVVIAAHSSDVFTVLPISTKTQNFRQHSDFYIRADDADFPATGLSHDSIVLGSPVFRIRSDQIIKTLGQLRGDLAARFKKWLGD